MTPTLLSPSERAAAHCGFGIGVVFTVVVSCLLAGREVPGWLGQVASGVVSLAAAMFAAAAVERWSTQKRCERLAEVATEALISAADVWPTLRAAASEDDWHESGSYGVDADHFRGLQDSFWSDAWKKFQVSLLRAEAFLSPRAAEALQELWAVRDRMWDLAENLIDHCDRYGMLDGDYKPLVLALHGSDMNEAIAKAVDAVKRELHVYALYESEPARSRDETGR